MDDQYHEDELEVEKMRKKISDIKKENVQLRWKVKVNLQPTQSAPIAPVLDVEEEAQFLHRAHCLGIRHQAKMQNRRIMQRWVRKTNESVINV